MWSRWSFRSSASASWSSRALVTCTPGLPLAAGDATLEVGAEVVNHDLVLLDVEGGDVGLLLYEVTYVPPWSKMTNALTFALRFSLGDVGNDPTGPRLAAPAGRPGFLEDSRRVIIRERLDCPSRLPKTPEK